jgi:hypothetical protein
MTGKIFISYRRIDESGHAGIALIVLWLVDMELNQGHYADVTLTVARGVARSIGIR